MTTTLKFEWPYDSPTDSVEFWEPNRVNLRRNQKYVMKRNQNMAPTIAVLAEPWYTVTCTIAMYDETGAKIEELQDITDDIKFTLYAKNGTEQEQKRVKVDPRLSMFCRRGLKAANRHTIIFYEVSA